MSESREASSVAPLEGSNNTCPECRQPTAYYYAGSRANVCTRFNCNYYEKVTNDHVRREWSEAEIRAIAREEAVLVSQGYENGQPVMGVARTHAPGEFEDG
jgi:hypothetical protein